MSQEALKQQLKIREQELIKVLEAIQVLIGTYENDLSKHSTQHSTYNDSVLLPKGRMSWEDYAVFLLDKVGGEAKATTIADYAVNANPTLDPDTVRRAIKTKLSIAFRERKIDAIKSEYRKEGYTYKTIPKMKRTKFPDTSIPRGV